MAALLIVEDDKQTNEAICEYQNRQGIKLFPLMTERTHYGFSIKGILTLLY